MRSTEDVEWVDVCPKCGRVLVTAYIDGTFDLASKAAVLLEATLDHEPSPGEEVPTFPVQGSGTCELCNPSEPPRRRRSLWQRLRHP